MNWLEAMEKHLYLLEEYKSGRLEYNSNKSMSPILGDAICNGDTYSCSEKMCQVLYQLAETIPNWTMTLEQLPSRAGFILLQAPYPISRLGPHPEGQMVTGFLWTTTFWRERPGPTRTRLVRAEELAKGILDHPSAYTEVVYIMPMLRRPELEGWTLFAELVWFVGDELDAYHEEPRDAHGPRKLFATLCVLLQQRLLVTQKEQPPRAWARRASRLGLANPIVRIVELRRQEAARHDPLGDHAEVEWACRWLVTGHWRRQWYSSLDVHRPIWILPYVKGPEDKPLRVPRQRVYMISR